MTDTTAALASGEEFLKRADPEDALSDAYAALVGEARGVATLGRQLAAKHGLFVWDRLNPATNAELLERLASALTAQAGDARRVVTALLDALRPLCPRCGKPLSDDDCICGYESCRDNPMTRDGTPGLDLEKVRAKCAGVLTSTDDEKLLLAEVDRLQHALNGVARPALTVERLAELLMEWEYEQRKTRMVGCHSYYDAEAQQIAAYVLPRLAGPAQEGLHG